MLLGRTATGPKALDNEQLSPQLKNLLKGDISGPNALILQGGPFGAQICQSEMSLNAPENHTK